MNYGAYMLAYASVLHLTIFFLRHGGPPPKALHQSGLTMGKMSVHGEPKFSEGQPRVFTNQVRVKTLHELLHLTICRITWSLWLGTQGLTKLGLKLMS